MDMQYAVLAEYVSESSTGNVNLMGIFDHISAVSYPARHPSLTVAFRMRVTASEAEGPPLNVAIKLLNASGDMLVELRSETHLKRPDGWWGWWDQKLQLNNVVFPQAGEYVFSLLVNGMERATIPLRMTHVSPPQLPVDGTLPDASE